MLDQFFEKSPKSQVRESNGDDELINYAFYSNIEMKPTKLEER